jgi:eukaryotic-like serine/threonine-protein kinase
MAFSAGDKLGPYEIVSRIGAGGMGEVWKARDTRLDRIVALKISKSEFSARFEREARAIAALNHPHICQLYDVGPDFLVMEYIEGAELNGPMPVARAIEFASQILDALDAAHRKGIVHRDLKPANILVTKSGVKVLDFGLAKMQAQAAAAGTDALTAVSVEGNIAGTLYYMAPEQLQGKDVDSRADIFSFGCVLYEMLTGKRAFDGSNAASVIAAVMETPAPSVAKVAPAALDRIVATCLAKDPDQRFQNARDLKLHLLWTTEQKPEARVKSRRLPWLAIAAAILIAGLAGAEFMHLRQPVSSEERPLRLSLAPPEGGRFIPAVGYGGGLTLSPDGRYAAFVASVSGKTALWLRPLDGTNATVLPGTDGATMPFWSPDSRSLGFIANRKLQRIDIGGQAPQVICEVQPFARAGMWTEDGTIVFAPDEAALLRVPISGGMPTPFTRLDASLAEDAHQWPVRLPGRKFLYWVASEKPENQAVYAASLDKPADRVRILTSTSSALYAPPDSSRSEKNGHLLWARGSTLMAQGFDAGSLRLLGEPEPVVDPVSFGFSEAQPAASVSGTGLLAYDSTVIATQSIWFDRNGKSLGNAAEAGPAYEVRLSPDSRRAAFVVPKASGGDLWLREWERGVSTRLTFAETLQANPVWSADGLSLLFSAGQPMNLYRMRIDNVANAVRLTRSPKRQDAIDWSRDGRFALYQEGTPQEKHDLWILPLTEPDSKPKPYLQTPFDELNGRFSPEPNPRWVAYQSDETGKYEVYIQAFPEPHAKVQISVGGGTFPQWGPGGRELYYLAPDNKLMTVSLKAGADSILPSAPSVLFALPPLSAIFYGVPYQVDSTGQRFLLAAAPQDKAAPLNLIVNWQSLLKK